MLTTQQRAAITALAGTNQIDDLSVFDNNSTPAAALIAEALKERRAETAKKNAADAADAILKLLGDSVSSINHFVSAIRDHRKNIAALLERIKLITRARAYGEATMDFRPLVDLLEGVKDPAKVPDDFVEPKTAAPKAERSKKAVSTK